MTNLNSFGRQHWPAILILCLSIIIGVKVFRNYGIAWDEPLQREIGLRSYNYVAKTDTTLNGFKNRDYGVAVELPLIFAEKALNLKDSREIYRMRHLLVHLFFLASAFAFYFLIWILYRNRWLAVTGYLFLLLSPRIYSQSFFNSKDIPFMCMFIFNFLACLFAFRNKKFRYFILMGILSGLHINIRVMGVLFPVIVCCLAVVDIAKRDQPGKTVLLLLAYAGIMISVLYFSWPWLWDAPVERFRIAFTNMSKFRWDNNLLMNGSFVRASTVGWDYLPRWFGMTTPLAYLLLGLMGMLLLIRNFIQKPGIFIANSSERNHIVYFLCFAGPIIAVIALHSVLYDGWRQMYFIYPAFLMLSIYGLNSLFRSSLSVGDLPRVSVIFLILVLLSGTAYTMIKSHPFEDVYFNILVRKSDQYLRKTFELDYWGTSYKQALEYIVQHDSSDQIVIRVANLPGVNNSLLLKPSDRIRLRYGDTDEQASYFITNYRWHPRDYLYPERKKIFSITIQNSEICTAWKLH